MPMHGLQKNTKLPVAAGEKDSMATLLEYIELCEGEKEMATIVKTMRSLGKDVDEIGQYLEKSTGKKLKDISDKELAFMAGQGAKAGQSVAPQADADPELQKDFKDAQTAMDIPFVGPKMVAKRVRDKMPSGTYSIYTPSGDTVDIDVDISGSDLKAIKKAAERAGKTFPQALSDLQSGNFSSALGRVIDRTVK